MTDETTRTYEIVTDGATLRIGVPASARVSYGPVIGVGGKSSYGGNCLRVWKGTKATEIQIALFQNVTSFRDLALPMQVRAVRKFGSEDWYLDDGHTWTGPKADQVERAWVSSDEIKDGIPPGDEPTDDGLVPVYPSHAMLRKAR